jgi:predicted permease
MKELWRRLEWFFRRSQFEAELEEEIRHHQSLLGDPRRFGNATLIKEDSRLMWMGRLPGEILQDLRYGLRAMVKNKLFTTMAVLSLALGIGANTAIFSFMDAVLMRRLPVNDPGRLTILNWSSRDHTPVVHGVNGSMFGDDARGRVSPNFPYPAWLALREGTKSFQDLFAYARAYRLNAIANGQAEVLDGEYVSGDYFAALGVTPARGRLIAEDDDKPGAPPVVTISYDYWQSHFAARPDIAGTQMRVNNLPFTIIGVSAPGFSGVDAGRNARVVLPLHIMPLLAPKPDEEFRHRFLDRNFYWLEMMGRLRPGVSMAQAETEIQGVFNRYVESTVGNEKELKGAKPRIWLEAGAGGLDTLQRRYSKPLFVLMTMVGLILAIACANVANLMLSRAAARRREIAVRMSLGAARWRLVRQLLTESLALSLSGGIIGVGVAYAGIRGISWLITDPLDGFLLQPALNWSVLLFTFGLAVLTGIVFGLAPALQATKIAVTPGLKEVRASANGRGRGIGLGSALIVSQVAMSLVLAIAAGLFVRTLTSLNAVELGFNRENVLVFSVDGKHAGYKDQALVNVYADMRRRFRRIPGVRSVGMSGYLLVSYHWNDEPLTIPGRASKEGPEKLSTALMSVDAGFLPTMQIPIVLGRGLDERDMESPRVAVVNELFAKKYFPGVSPIGQRIGISDHAVADIEIVGVAKTTLYNNLKEQTPELAYVPYTQDLGDLWGVSFELRTAGDPLALGGTVRRIVHDVSSAIPVTDLSTQAAVIDNTISQQRTFADLCSGFAILALLIACVGLYGTMAYAVERRTSEIGIRMALGAKRGRIVWMVLRQVCVLMAVGLAIGWGTAWETGHFVASFLYGVKPNDALVMAGSAGALVAAAIAAGFGPAWRASRIAPMTALRHE